MRGSGGWGVREIRRVGCEGDLGRVGCEGDQEGGV